MIWTVLEWSGVLFSILCVVYTIRKNVICWPLGIVGVSCFAILFFNVKLYADFGLQLIFLIQSVYGWYYWINPKEKTEPPIVRLNLIQKLVTLLVIIFGSLGLGSFLHVYTDASIPFVDAITSVLSIVANWFLAKKIFDSWMLWIAADILYIGMFAYKELFVVSCLYVLFLGLAISGYINWKRDIHHTLNFKYA